MESGSSEGLDNEGTQYLGTGTDGLPVKRRWKPGRDEEGEVGLKEGRLKERIEANSS